MNNAMQLIRYTYTRLLNSTIIQSMKGEKLARPIFEMIGKAGIEKMMK